MTKSSKAEQMLRQRLEENPRLPATTRHILKSLASDAAAPVWEFFGHDEPKVLRVVDRSRQAYEQTLEEMARPSSTQEQQDIESIIAQANKLKTAIRSSALPGRTAYLDRYELQAEDLPNVPLDVGWHTLSSRGHFGFGYPLAICDVLDWAVELAQQHLDNRPARAIARKKDQPEVTVFVRLLAWHFRREFGEEYRTAISHIASAVFDLTEPLDVKSVDGRLKDRQAPFSST